MAFAALHPNETKRTAAQLRREREDRESAEAISRLKTDRHLDLRRLLRDCDLSEIEAAISGHLLNRPDLSAQEIIEFGDRISRKGWDRLPAN